MCGFAGILRPGPTGANELLADVTRMARSLEHRGPDDEGIWCEPSDGVAFGFRRLSIVDLSELGHQPMTSGGGRFTMVFNGEVYNHVELRKDLEKLGYNFRGDSDTEVMLGAFEAWGIEAAVRRFVGMFAIALWDRSNRCLHLIRDRLGIKPLFVHWRGGRLLIASELKAMLALPDFDRTIDRSALAAYCRYLYVPAPQTIFQNTWKVLPGHILTIRDVRTPPPPSTPYWSAERAALKGISRRVQGSDAEIVEEMDRLLTSAVALRMRADVPVGAFLSGGIDSSTVVALMQAGSARPVKTFTIGFAEDDYNEAIHAERIARHLGTDHTGVMLTGADALAMVPHLAHTFDEPLADPSQIPTWLVSRVARQQVTVALSGDGGDEILGGYNRYTHGQQLLSRAAHLPAHMRQLAARGILGVSTDNWNRAYKLLSPLLRGRATHRLAGEKLHKVGHVLSNPSPAGMYRSLLSAWQDPAELVIDGPELDGSLERVMGGSLLLSQLDQMMLTDQLSYLPDDLLAKVDRASMAESLEARVPLLDHRVVEFSWRLGHSHKIRNGTGKWVLREVLRRYVPDELTVRPKMGFSVPIARWLRGPLREWAESLLSEEKLRDGGLFRPHMVRHAWRQLQAGHDSNATGVWSILMFQAWHSHWLDTTPRVAPRPQPRRRAVTAHALSTP